MRSSVAFRGSSPFPIPYVHTCHGPNEGKGGYVPYVCEEKKPPSH
jgi:hypothetical protein